MYASDIDYPACHSMDTEWFAIDKNGCVAIMDSDEAGALPLSAIEGGCDSEILKRNLNIVDGTYKLEIDQKAIEKIKQLCISNTSTIDYEGFRGFIILNDKVTFKDLKMATLENYLEILPISVGDNIYHIDIEYIKGVGELFLEDIYTGYIKHYFETKNSYRCKTQEDLQQTFEYLVGFFYYKSDYNEIYNQTIAPPIPLDVSKFNQSSDLVKINNIDFTDKPFFNPMQYISCRTWGTKISPKDEKYCIINIGDNKTATVRLSNEYLLNEKISPYFCYKCYKEKKQSERDFHIQRISMLTDYPQILILSDYPKRDYDYPYIDLSALNIDENTTYTSFAVKCIKTESKPKGIIQTFFKKKEQSDQLDDLIKHFKNCHSLLEEELQMLHIQIIICYPNSYAWNLLKSQYTIVKNQATHFHTIEINNKKLYLVNWNEMYLTDEVFLDRLHRILNQDRHITHQARILE